ncbi:hypothetical protein C8R46DRAFT_1082979 [Mycena filopes]|nr:hypothetical protein C8R46DRAFT_1082979 [Mycena filopes]
MPALGRVAGRLMRPRKRDPHIIMGMLPRRLGMGTTGTHHRALPSLYRCQRREPILSPRPRTERFLSHTRFMPLCLSRYSSPLTPTMRPHLDGVDLAVKRPKTLLVTGKCPQRGPLNLLRHRTLTSRLCRPSYRILRTLALAGIRALYRHGIRAPVHEAGLQPGYLTWFRSQDVRVPGRQLLS